MCGMNGSDNPAGERGDDDQNHLAENENEDRREVKSLDHRNQAARGTQERIDEVAKRPGDRRRGLKPGKHHPDHGAPEHHLSAPADQERERRHHQTENRHRNAEKKTREDGGQDRDTERGQNSRPVPLAGRAHPRQTQTVVM